jgi:hypothetical protein
LIFADGVHSEVGPDVPVGTVFMHGTINNGPHAGVTWTSPIDGSIDLTGDIWQAEKTGQHAGRSMQWNILLNGQELTGGTVSWDDTFDSANPFDFAAGSGGASVLDDLLVSIGDVVTLEIFSPVEPSFAGLNFTVTQVDVPEPSTALLLFAFVPLIARRRHAKPSHASRVCL